MQEFYAIYLSYKSLESKLAAVELQQLSAFYIEPVNILIMSSYKIHCLTVFVWPNQSDTAGVKIPELDLELASGTLGGIVTTVEGLITKISESKCNF